MPNELAQNLSVTREISREVLDMCNLSTGVLNRGISIGEMRGDLNRAKKTAYRLRKKGMSLTEIADIVDASVTTVQEWLAEP